MKNKKQKSMAKSNGGKKMTAPPANLSDLVANLSEDGATVVTTISPNAQWSGIQKFVDPTINDGAVSVLNKNYPSPGSAPPTEEVAVSGPGFYRGWSSDFDYTVHTSNWVEVL